jgi:hypothetical protein
MTDACDEEYIDVTFSRRQPEYEENVLGYMDSECVTADVTKRRILRDIKYIG